MYEPPAGMKKEDKPDPEKKDGNKGFFKGIV